MKGRGRGRRNKIEREEGERKGEKGKESGEIDRDSEGGG